MAFRAAVLEACLAERCVCGFSLRLIDGLIGRCRTHRQAGPRGPDEVPNARLGPCALHPRLFDHISSIALGSMQWMPLLPSTVWVTRRSAAMLHRL